MPTHTITIPLTSIPANTPTVLGQVTTNQSLTSAAITIDRTISGGLNSLTNADIYTMSTSLSFDGGVTFTPWSSITTEGGNIPSDTGFATTTIDNFAFNPAIPHKTVGQTTVTCTSAVQVQGSVTLTD